LRIFSFILVWNIAMVWIGIALKRSAKVQPPSVNTASTSSILGPGETLKVWCWLVFDLVLIFCVTATILRVQVINRVAQGRPENICNAVSPTLNSPTTAANERVNALFKLAQVHTDQATDILRHAAREQPAPVNLVAAANLLGRDDLVGLSILETSLMHSSQLGSPSPTGDYWMNLEVMLSNVTDPAAAPILARLMTSPEFGTRRGAAHALRNIHTTATIDSLIKGLDDSDVEVRYFSVTGLAAATLEPHQMHDWYPSRGKYALNEQYYLDHWKAWAKARGQVGP
jgi:hypothetical protein